MAENTRLDDKILELAMLADQIRAIAKCATRIDTTERDCELTRANAMHGIETISEMLSDKLAALSDVVEGVTI